MVWYSIFIIFCVNNSFIKAHFNSFHNNVREDWMDIITNKSYCNGLILEYTVWGEVLQFFHSSYEAMVQIHVSLASSKLNLADILFP